MACSWCHNPETLSVKPQLMVYPKNCIGCGACVKACKAGARTIENGILHYDRSVCTGCGACAKACPVGAIPDSHPEQTDKNRCISCMRCIQICPVKARSLNKAVLSVAGCSMKKVCSGRKRMNYI